MPRRGRFTGPRSRRLPNLVCSDGGLLMLPWELLPVGGSRLIELAGSFTINPSITAAALPLRGAAPLAEAGAGGDPRRDARAGSSVISREKRSACPLFCPKIVASLWC